MCENRLFRNIVPYFYPFSLTFTHLFLIFTLYFDFYTFIFATLFSFLKDIFYQRLYFLIVLEQICYVLQYHLLLTWERDTNI